MDLLTHIFGHLCGQSRCLVIDGTSLPVCQRCTGLYIGALLTAAWLLTTQIRRRGVPPASVAWGYGAALIAALFGGIHVLDFGPRWRLLCGLWTGHVVLVWLFTGATQLWAWSRGRSSESLVWTRRETLAAWVALAALAAVALAWPAPLSGPWSVWACATVAGGAMLAATAVRAIVLLSLAARGFIPGREAV
jgi:uncharacterized membrane protein